VTPPRKRFVLGVGTGRSGTQSLAALLHAQPGCFVTHELRHPVTGKRPGLLPSWHGSTNQFVNVFDFLRSYPGTLVGDVGFYWLPFLEFLLESGGVDVRVIGLRRPRDGTVKSYLARTDTRRHYWLAKVPVDKCAPDFYYSYPKYVTETSQEALVAYWNGYMDRLRDLQRRYPDGLRVWGMSRALNTRKGVREVLSFAGVPKTQQQVHVGVRLNQRSR